MLPLVLLDLHSCGCLRATLCGGEMKDSCEEEVRSSLNSYSSEACCSVLMTGPQATLKLDHQALGRAWVDEICPVFCPWAGLFPSHQFP